jgi:hypothetical protein
MRADGGGLGLVTLRSHWQLRQKLRDAFDEAPGSGNRRLRVLGRDGARSRAGAVIGDGFVLVGFGEEGEELAGDAGVIARQPAELTAQAAMCLGRLAGALKRYASAA